MGSSHRMEESEGREGEAGRLAQAPSLHLAKKASVFLLAWYGGLCLLHGISKTGVGQAY